MPLTSTSRLATAFAAGTLLVAGCAGSGSGTTSPSAGRPGPTDPPAVAPADPPRPSPSPAAPADVPVVPPTDVPVRGSDDGDGPFVTNPLPADDAVVVRDQLLALAGAADFGAGHPDTAMIQSWLTAYPDLQLTIFDDQPAGPSTVSSSSTFLLTEVTSAYDQAFGFAVADRSGRCAGGVIVIPGTDDAAATTGSAPSIFTPVDDLAVCTAEQAIAELVAA